MHRRRGAELAAVVRDKLGDVCGFNAGNAKSSRLDSGLMSRYINSNTGSRSDTKFARGSNINIDGNSKIDIDGSGNTKSQRDAANATDTQITTLLLNFLHPPSRADPIHASNPATVFISDCVSTNCRELLHSQMRKMVPCPATADALVLASAGFLWTAAVALRAVGWGFTLSAVPFAALLRGPQISVEDSEPATGTYSDSSFTTGRRNSNSQFTTGSRHSDLLPHTPRSHSTQSSHKTIDNHIVDTKPMDTFSSKTRHAGQQHMTNRTENTIFIQTKRSCHDNCFTPGKQSQTTDPSFTSQHSQLNTRNTQAHKSQTSHTQFTSEQTSGPHINYTEHILTKQSQIRRSLQLNALALLQSGKVIRPSLATQPLVVSAVFDFLTQPRQRHLAFKFAADVLPLLSMDSVEAALVQLIKSAPDQHSAERSVRWVMGIVPGYVPGVDVQMSRIAKVERRAERVQCAVKMMCDEVLCGAGAGLGGVLQSKSGVVLSTGYKNSAYLLKSRAVSKPVNSSTSENMQLSYHLESNNLQPANRARSENIHLASSLRSENLQSAGHSGSDLQSAGILNREKLQSTQISKSSDLTHTGNLLHTFNSPSRISSVSENFSRNIKFSNPESSVQSATFSASAILPDKANLFKSETYLQSGYIVPAQGIQSRNDTKTASPFQSDSLSKSKHLFQTAGLPLLKSPQSENFSQYAHLLPLDNLSQMHLRQLSNSLNSTHHSINKFLLTAQQWLLLLGTCIALPPASRASVFTAVLRAVPPQIVLYMLTTPVLHSELIDLLDNAKNLGLIPRSETWRDWAQGIISDPTSYSEMELPLISPFQEILNNLHVDLQLTRIAPQVLTEAQVKILAKRRAKALRYRKPVRGQQMDDVFDIYRMCVGDKRP